jgi:hypothetical protein
MLSCRLGKSDLNRAYIMRHKIICQLSPLPIPFNLISGRESIKLIQQVNFFIHSLKSKFVSMEFIKSSFIRGILKRAAGMLSL